MQIRIITIDTASSDLEALQARVKSLGPMWKAIGVGIVSLSKNAFNDATLRPSPWAAKYGGGVATLKKSGTLFRSIRVVAADESGVTVGSDRKYAAAHQLGAKTKPHLIKPKNGKALAFGRSYRGLGGAVSGGLGVTIVRAVKHPGSNIPARPFLPFHADGAITEKGDKLVRDTITAYIEARGSKS